MYNPKNTEHNKSSPGAPHPALVSPRISFSIDSSPAAAAYRDAPVSSDFEFSVNNYSMMSADELFFEGRLRPLKEGNQKTTTTLRDELLNHEDDAGEFSLRPPKNPTRWRGFLGLRKSNVGSKNTDKAVEKRPSPCNDNNNNNNGGDDDV